MYRGARVGVVIPAYQEQRQLPRTLDRIPDFVDHVIVVDDGSTDRTAELASGIARVDLIQHAVNSGVGSAIATGYRRAQHVGVDVAVVVGADGQMHPDDMPTLLDVIVEGRADYAKGNRLDWPGARRVMPLPRWVGNHALSWLTRRATGSSVHDSQCGYTAISRRGIESLDLDALWPRYGYPNDLIARFSRAGARVVDVPVRPIYGSEQSGVSVWDALVVIPYVLCRGALSTRRK